MYSLYFLIACILSSPLAMAQAPSGIRMANRVLESYIGQRVVVEEKFIGEKFNSYFSGRIVDVFITSKENPQNIQLTLDSLVQPKWIEDANPDEKITISARDIVLFENTTHGLKGNVRGDVLGQVSLLHGKNNHSEYARVTVLTRYTSDRYTSDNRGGTRDFYDVLVSKIQRDEVKARSHEIPMQSLIEPYVVLLTPDSRFNSIGDRSLESLPLPPGVLEKE